MQKFPPRFILNQAGPTMHLVLLLALTLALAAPVWAARDFGTRLDANRLSFAVSNAGSFGFAPVSGTSAFEYPRGSGLSSLYAGGLWVGAKVNGELRVALAEYAMDWAPGPMSGGTYRADLPEFRVYRVSANDTTGAGAWMTYAVPQGAPTSAGGTAPLVLGSQTTWAIYNDANPALHTSQAGRTAPLGLEVAQLAWSYEELSPRRDMAFLRYRLRNGGSATLDSAYVALWGDVDLGGGGDDRMGSDVARGLVYAYNGDDDDFAYGATPPAIGFKRLEGPPLSAMNTYIGGTDPDTALATWNLLRGRQVSGAPWIDPTTLGATPFVHPGDPIANTGWVAPLNSELRMMLVAGPFTLAPGDTQAFTCAIVLARGSGRLDSVRLMRAKADSVDLEGAYAPLVPIPPPPGPEPSTALSFAQPASPQAGPVLLRAVAPVGAGWRLDAYDVRGRRAARIATGVGTGFVQETSWTPALDGLRSGVYFIALASDADRVTHRVVVLGP